MDYTQLGRASLKKGNSFVKSTLVSILQLLFIHYPNVRLDPNEKHNNYVDLMWGVAIAVFYPLNGYVFLEIYLCFVDLCFLVFDHVTCFFDAHFYPDPLRIDLGPWKIYIKKK